MENNHLVINRHEFKLGDWVHINGNRNLVAEVIDAKEDQLKVKMITQPNKGQIIYTTKYTYYTIPISYEEKLRIAPQLEVVVVPKVVLREESLTEEVEQTERKDVVLPSETVEILVSEEKVSRRENKAQEDLFIETPSFKTNKIIVVEECEFEDVETLVEQEPEPVVLKEIQEDVQLSLF